MANTSLNRPPGLSLFEALPMLQDMQGLSLILGRISEDSTVVQNTSESVNALKNSMAWAKPIMWSDINRVAKVPTGTSKFVSSTDRPDAFRPDGTSVVTTDNSKSFVLGTDGYLHLMICNEDLNNRSDLYGSRSFAKGIPTFKGSGFHKESGWLYATIGKMFDGVHDDIGNSWMPVRNYMDEWREHKGLNFKNEKSQSTRICGAGNEERTGTCCLYYKNNHYDNITGITYEQGDYYKCTCAKCYHCLELARALKMDYVFNAFTGTGPTGGAGERCQDCDLDNPPTNCGPCACSIETRTEYDTLISDPNIPEGSIIKANARIAKDWKENLAGSVFVHIDLDSVGVAKREINRDYWGVEKSFTISGPQVGSTTKTKYSLVTEIIGKNKEYIIGIKRITTGTYTGLPNFPEDKLIDMVPGLDASYFNMVRVPDFSELSKVVELVGGTQTQIRTTVKYEDIKSTNISDFNIYGIGVLKTVKGNPFFSSSNNITTSKRLTHKNSNITRVGPRNYNSTEDLYKDLKNNINQQYENVNTNTISTIANIYVIDLSTIEIELYSGNTNDITKDFSIIDIFSNTFTANNEDWSKPTSSVDGELLDAQKTEVIHVNRFSLTIPDKKLIGAENGFRTPSATITLTLGSG